MFEEYQTCRSAAIEASREGLRPMSAMLAAGVPLETADRLWKSFASDRKAREIVDELLHGVYSFALASQREVNRIRMVENSPDDDPFGEQRPVMQELKRARDIATSLLELDEKLQSDIDDLRGLSGMDESVISISLVKKRALFEDEQNREVSPDE